MFKVRIVQAESEHRQVDHLAINEQEVTLCGVQWSHATRREWFQGDRSTREQVECYKCKEAARYRVVASLEASRVLAQWASLDFKSIKRHAGY